MKVIGIILILIGIGVFIFLGIRSTRKEKVLDVGPVEITKQVERSDSWQLYAAGGIAVVAGLILVFMQQFFSCLIKLQEDENEKAPRWKLAGFIIKNINH